MSSDAAYAAKVLPVARTLWNAAQGDCSRISDFYAECLQHSYSDGFVSLVPAIVSFDNTDTLEDWQFDEAVELLSRVDPDCWPDVSDIKRVDLEALLNSDSEDTPEFVEDNLGTSHTAQKVIQKVIESVFGDNISDIRSVKGHFPSPDNNFLQDEDGTFVGTFLHGNHKFDFEIAPTEAGWICTYRLNAKSLDKLPRSEAKEASKHGKKEYQRRKTRFRGW
jgi:hypothetical protein